MVFGQDDFPLRGGGGWEDGTAHRLFIDLYSTRSSARTGWVLATGRVLAIKLN